MKTKLLIAILCLLISDGVFARSCHHYRHHWHKTRSCAVEQRVYYQTVYVPVYYSQNYQPCAPCYPQRSSCCSESQNNCSVCHRGGFHLFPQVNCQCADPACSYCNPCLSCSCCCAAFGNVGSGDFGPIGCSPF